MNTPKSLPKTLLEMAGADLTPARFDEACLVLIDCQNEYLSGPVALPDAQPAVGEAKRLLAAARSAGAPVVHVVHRGRAGGMFDLDAERGAIIDGLTPEAGEAVIEKPLPNAFAQTGLEEALVATGRRKLIVAGFMTHMCVSATARAALDHGFGATVAADACATRDLPDGTGGVVAARDVHRVALAELADRFAIIARGPDWF
jgi:nicotinamidase-related amidase